MPDPAWYYIGPDKTGFSCPNCCYGFSSSGGACLPVACPTPPSKFRNFLCPNSTYPTPNHIYAWDGDPDTDVYIAVNSIVCPTSVDYCWSWAPTTGLNAAGRIGSGCNQDTVELINNCTFDTADCPGTCPEECTRVGNIIFPYYCSVSSAGCSCQLSSSYASCFCYCPEDPCPYGEASVSCRGETVTYCITPGAGPPICDCEGDPPSDCGPCGYECGTDGYYFCRPTSCSTSCSSGFSCSCGTCECNTASTCCVGPSSGWVYMPAVPATSSASSLSGYCKPCYDGWRSSEYVGPPDCCYFPWKAKNCQTDEWCCNDGRCYESETILCDFWPPS
jgi:hypothetical protein